MNPYHKGRLSKSEREKLEKRNKRMHMERMRKRNEKERQEIKETENKSEMVADSLEEPNNKIEKPEKPSLDDFNKRTELDKPPLPKLTEQDEDIKDKYKINEENPHKSKYKDPTEDTRINKILDKNEKTITRLGKMYGINKNITKTGIKLVKKTQRMGKRYKKLLLSGSIMTTLMTIVGSLGILVMFLYFLILAPMMTFILPSGALAILVESGEDFSAEKGRSQSSKEETIGDSSGGKITAMPEELKGKFIFPNVARVNSFQGDRFHPYEQRWKPHYGMDIAHDTPGKKGHKIYPIATGVVIESKWFGTLGNMVGIEHEDGYTSLYGHLEKSSVKVGDKVGLDTPIGIMGATGGNSTGIHLHLEMFKGGKEGFYKKDTRLVVEEMLSCTATKPMERKKGIHKECDDYQKKVRGI